MAKRNEKNNSSITSLHEANCYSEISQSSSLSDSKNKNLEKYCSETRVHLESNVTPMVAGATNQQERNEFRKNVSTCKLTHVMITFILNILNIEF